MLPNPKRHSHATKQNLFVLYVGNFYWFKERGGELLAGTKSRLQASIKVDINLHSNPQKFIN
jgi:hypothetical protein